jgi:hypothetical protein
MARRWFAAAAAAVLLLVAGMFSGRSVARAHIPPAKGPLLHKLIVRVAHDQGVIRSIDRQAHHAGSWMLLPIGLWRERSRHLADLRLALRGQLVARRAAEAARLTALRPLHFTAWLCIHRYEGSWSDAGDPYWGGLQMDRSFMATYGSDMIRRYGGYANVWPPLQQMVVAERAHAAGRGFSPWPNTARYCGLL